MYGCSLADEGGRTPGRWWPVRCVDIAYTNPVGDSLVRCQLQELQSYAGDLAANVRAHIIAVPGRGGARV